MFAKVSNALSSFYKQNKKKHEGTRENKIYVGNFVQTLNIYLAVMFDILLTLT